MNNNNNIINIRELNKTFIINNKNKLNIINQINFNIEINKTISITGPSGSGKSTFLNILGLLDLDFEGIYFFKGLDISNISKTKINELRGSSIGFIHQFFHLIPELTAIENVMLPILINNREKNAYDIAKKIMVTFELSDRLNYKPSKLSGGEQQRIAIARSLVHNPDIILADEMTGNLDEKTADSVFSFFMNYIKKNRKSLIYVTHNKRLSNFADKKYYFSNQKLLEDNE